MDRWNRIEHVTLWVHVESNTGVYRVYEKISTLPRRMVIVDKHHNDVSKWKKLNFVPNNQWLKNPWGKKIRMEIEGMDTPIADKPLLQLKVKPVKKRQRKRSVTTTMGPIQKTATDDCHPTHWSRCCRRTKIVPLQQYYQWIVVPQVFRSFTCSGTCHIKYRNNVTWTLLSQMTSPSRAPCCIPTGFNSMTLLIYDNQTATFASKTVHDLLVATCGCF